MTLQHSVEVGMGGWKNLMTVTKVVANASNTELCDLVVGLVHSLQDIVTCVRE